MFTKPSTNIIYNEQPHPQWEAQAKNDFVNNQPLIKAEGQYLWVKLALITDQITSLNFH
jgi:hypothetical protein